MLVELALCPVTLEGGAFGSIKRQKQKIIEVPHCVVCQEVANKKLYIDQRTEA